MRDKTVYLLILLCIAIPKLHSAFAGEFCIASWNVENLFDTEDDPDVQFDEDYTPDGVNHWTPEHLETKLKNLASIIGKMNGGRGPDVLGLCEIENRKVVEMLVAKLAPLGREYQIVHKDSPSDRGIDTALIYDAKLFTLADSKFHYVEADKTRDILEAKLRPVGAPQDGATLTVFVNHWPSRHNDEWQREAAAKVLRARVDEILAAEPKADLVMVGDFNDEPDNISLKDDLKAVTSSENLQPGSLFDTAAAIRAGDKGTYVWDDKWQLIDHIIISPGLLDPAGFHWKAGSTQTVEFPEQFFKSSRPGAIPRPSSSHSNHEFHENGYSDHLPLTTMIVQ